MCKLRPGFIGSIGKNGPSQISRVFLFSDFARIFIFPRKISRVFLFSRTPGDHVTLSCAFWRENEKMNSFLHLGQYLFGGDRCIIAYLRNKHLLAQSMTCSRCGIPMHEARRRDISDGFRWRCRQCKTSKSIRDGSFFSKSRLSLQKWLLLIYLWARDYPVKDVAQEAEIDRNNACDIMQWFREVCSATLIRNGIKLGGPGKVVQIDESLFRHKPKVDKLLMIKL